MKITLVSSSLSAGGAERVLSLMANHWASNQVDVTLITLDSSASDFYSLDRQVQRVALDVMKPSPNPLAALLNNLNRLWRLRSAIRESQPGAVISFIDQTNVLTLLATRGLGLKVIVSERIDPAMHPIGRLWGWLRQRSYPKADWVVVQTESVRRGMASLVADDRLALIPNPVVVIDSTDQRSLNRLIGNQEQRQTVIAMGRLTHQKGFDQLLQAFADVSEQTSGWRLVILGEGEQRDRLKQQAEQLGIADCLYLPGIIEQPQPLLRQADLFVLSSRYEGFPNALLEAMSCGVPVISFDCPSGPGEIIENDRNGVLVEADDCDALADAMARLMDDPELRQSLAKEALLVNERYSIDRVMAQWEGLIAKMQSAPSETET